jgi:Asp/Glu/hydantoin racemase
MHRVLSVTPLHVDTAELERRRRRYTALAPEGVQVQLTNLGPEAPRQLDSEMAIRASEQAVAAALSGPVAAGYDDLLPDCVLDPAVPSESGRFQPLGMLKLTMAHLASAGHRVGAVTRNTVIANELHRKITAYGYEDLLVGTTVLDLEVDDIADAPTWNAALHAAAGQLAARGASAVLNGCSAVEVTPPVDGPLLVDPAATALSLLTSGARR